MSEFKVHVPKSLEGEKKSIEIKVGEMISLEEKKKLLSDFIDKAMEGAKQLSDEELVEMGRELKRSNAVAQ
jgi:hypothetical protein